MKALLNMIRKADKNELLFLQRIIDSGDIERLIAKKLDVYNEQEKKTCPVCGSRVEPARGIRIEFGPHWLRKQATFDAADCVEHFIRAHLRGR